MHKHKETQEDHNTEMFIRWMSKKCPVHISPQNQKDEEYDAFI